MRKYSGIDQAKSDISRRFLHDQPGPAGGPKAAFQSSVTRHLHAALIAIFFAALATQALTPSATPVTITFKDSVLVNDTAIYLGDIAEIAATEAAPVGLLTKTNIGEAAPAGFSRFLTPGDVTKYTLHRLFPALRFEVEGPARVSVRTDSQTKSVGDFEAQVIDFVSKSVSWPKQDFNVLVMNKQRELILLNKEFTASFAKLDSDYPKGPTNLQLLVTQGHRTLRIPVLCMVRIATPVLVARASIARGESAGALNSEMRRCDITNYKYKCYTDASSLSGMISVRTLSPGTILNDKLFTRMPVVKRDDEVALSVRKGVIRVSVAARARESGAVGDRIWVENLTSRSLVRATVQAKGEVAITDSKEKI